MQTIVTQLHSQLPASWPLLPPPQTKPNRSAAAVAAFTFYRQYERECKLRLVVVVELRERLHLLRRQAVQARPCLLPLQQGQRQHADKTSLHSGISCAFTLQQRAFTFESSVISPRTAARPARSGCARSSCSSRVKAKTHRSTRRALCSTAICMSGAA